MFARWFRIGCSAASNDMKKMSERFVFVDNVVSSSGCVSLWARHLPCLSESFLHDCLWLGVGRGFVPDQHEKFGKLSASLPRYPD